MKIYNDIEQGTTEWKKLRWGLIGSSSAKDAMVGNIETAAIIDQLVFEHSEDYEESDDYVNAAMQRGTDLEPFARKELEQLTGETFFVPGWIQSDVEILGISPDGINDLERPTSAAEFKCPGGKTHAKYLRDNSLLLSDYAWQIVAYFAAIPTIDKLYVSSYRPESKIKKLLVIEVTRSTEIKTSGAAKSVPLSVDCLAAELIARALHIQNIIKSEINRLSF